LSNLSSRLPSLTTVLWILASLVAFGAFLFIAPNLLNPPSPTITPTRLAALSPTAKPTATIPATFTPIPIAPPPHPRTQEPTPTVPEGAQVYNFVADPTRSGYLKAGEDKAHWGDRNLHTGFFSGDTYSSILYFEIAQLPPNSEILSAEVDVTGLSRDNLGAAGEWRAELIRVKPFEDWGTLTATDLLNAPAMSSIGTSLEPADLDLGETNRFTFSADQLPALANQAGETTYAIVRLVGPKGPDNSLFTWDGGGIDLKTGAHPILRIVARPGNFIIVTNTPTAENVVTAAALAVRQTDFANQFGTPTPFPRAFATATPIILVTKVPTPENVETRVAIAQVATAVAITTGTYTPTPENWIEVTATFTPLPTRTPEVIPVSTLYARLTPTVPPTNTPTIRQMLASPLPDFLKGNLLILTDRFNGQDIAVMRPDGTLIQGLTGDEYYKLAAVREPFSPDRQRRVIVAPDASDILQIWVEDENSGTRNLITHLARGIAYDPVWSPDGSKIAYVSRETGSDEIYVYDLGNGTSMQLTRGGNPFIYKQRPTWSPDSKHIAFKANDGTLNFQIWIMNADGSNPHNVSNSTSNDSDPIWVK
jgi:hypothetical protein